MIERQRRVSAIVLICMIIAAGTIFQGLRQREPKTENTIRQVAGVATTNPDGTPATPASEALKRLAIKGRAPKTGYKRTQFGDGWQTVGGCDVRNHVLKRDMQNTVTKSDTDCTVVSGVLYDPYTSKTIDFKRGTDTSDDVQIDHVVALSDAWQKGAQQLAPDQRQAFANDMLNLLAVDGPTNQKKGDGDAATWLPPNKAYRCRYVARQIAVKIKYTLWLTQSEHDAISNVLDSCPSQQLPIVS